MKPTTLNFILQGRGNVLPGNKTRQNKTTNEPVRKSRILISCVVVGKPFLFSDIHRIDEKVQGNFLIQKVFRKACFIGTDVYVLVR